MNAAICVTNGLADREAWATHLHMRGYESIMTDTASLPALKSDGWTRCGLLLSHASAKKWQAMQPVL